MAAAATRARGGGVPRPPFAPVAVSPAQEENRMAREDGARRFGDGACGPAVLGPGGGGKPAKKCGPGASPVCASSKKTPPAAQRTAARRRRLDSCAKKCSTPAPAAGSVSVAEKAVHDAPACDAAEERDGKVRAKLSFPCIEVGQERRGSEAGQERRGSEAGQERRGSEAGQERRGGEAGQERRVGEAATASASRKRAMRSVAVEMEEAMAGLPEPGEGRVKYLVDTFERLLLLAGGGRGLNPKARNRDTRRRKNEATAAAVVSAPATPPRAEEIDVSYPSIASSSEVSFPAIAGVACILDASDRTRISRARGQRRQRAYNSTGSSSNRAWSSRKLTRVTTQHPFNLRTEQRGKAKEGNFVERLRKMQLEEERLRNPIAQGLPFTTDEPESPAKPPPKEPTELIDLVLHSEVRGISRAKFDTQVAERITFMEEVRLERERQQKVDEEIEIKQLRKEQVPRAHPMPDFSRPFVPKRSVKPQTIPREPKFQPRLMKRISKA